MRRVVPLVLAVALFVSACVSGESNVSPPDPAAPGASAIAAPPQTDPDPGTGDGSTSTTPSTSTTSTAPRATTVPTPAGSADTSVVTGESVGRPWGEVVGLTMFRGNPTRTFYGSGPVSRIAPEVAWSFPDQPMCGQSPVGKKNKVWCGSGWTGQPVVWERPDGITEVIFGAYDKQVHFLDAATGEPTRPSFDMGDIIKGSLTLDPDGFPLIYVGSRDPRYRVIALDGPEPREVWSLHAKSVEGIWNDDWDSNGVVVNDILYEGGENSWWFAVKLNRGYDDEGLVTVDPEVVFQMPVWTDELRETAGRQQSVENSTAVFGDRVFFATSAGRVLGLDVSNVEEGEAPIVLDFWMGDDTDATISVDEEGFIYVAAQQDLALKNNTAARRVREVGQLVKLDPDNPEDPVVWSKEIPASRGEEAGVWATPALVGNVLYVASNPGDLLAVDTATGETLWTDYVGGNAWSSPVVVDNTLVIAVDCLTRDPALRAYDVTDPAEPVRLWEKPLGKEGQRGCIESTPAIWAGQIFVGTRNGFFYALGPAA